MQVTVKQILERGRKEVQEKEQDLGKIEKFLEGDWYGTGTVSTFAWWLVPICMGLSGFGTENRPHPCDIRCTLYRVRLQVMDIRNLAHPKINGVYNDML